MNKDTFSKSIKNYLSAVTTFENTANIAGRDIRIANKEGKLKEYLDPIVKNLDGKKYPAKVNALRSMIMSNTDNKITLGRLKDKGFEVAEAKQTRQKDISISSLCKQLEVLHPKFAKCSALNLQNQGEVSKLINQVQTILKSVQALENESKKKSNKNGK